MKKILLLAPEYGLEKGGIQTWAYYIDKLFRKNGHNIKSFGVNDMNILKYFEVVKLNFKSDLFILMTWKMIIVLLPILFFTNKKIFIFIHGNDILNLPAYQMKIFNFLLKKDNILFVSNSEAIADIFKSIFNKKVNYVIAPFIDTDFSTNESIIENQFFTITRLVKRKNIVNVIFALKELDKKIDFKYYIAGEGEEKENLKSLVLKLKLSNKIIFLGRITEEEKNKYLATSSLFLLPSILDEKSGSVEGYGIVYIEANTFGLPVISGNTGGMIEAVIDGVTGLHTDGSTNDIINAFDRYERIKFNKVKIKQFAKKHDYRYQNDFVKYIIGE